MATCSICHHPIEKFQSHHNDGQRTVHYACAIGKTPALYAVDNAEAPQHVLDAWARAKSHGRKPHHHADTNGK